MLQNLSLYNRQEELKQDDTDVVEKEEKAEALKQEPKFVIYKLVLVKNTTICAN